MSKEQVDRLAKRNARLVSEVMLFRRFAGASLFELVKFHLDLCLFRRERKLGETNDGKT